MFILRKSKVHTNAVKIIKKNMCIEDYRKYKYELRDAIFDTAIDLSDTETHTLMEAAFND